MYGAQVFWVTHFSSGVFQNRMSAKRSKPFVLQKSVPPGAFVLHASGAAGSEPNHSDTAACTSGFSDHSSHLYAQTGCGASATSIVVSAQPVQPSFGIVDSTGWPSPLSEFT